MLFNFLRLSFYPCHLCYAYHLDLPSEHSGRFCAIMLWLLLAPSEVLVVTLNSQMVFFSWQRIYSFFLLLLPFLWLSVLALMAFLMRAKIALGGSTQVDIILRFSFVPSHCAKHIVSSLNLHSSMKSNCFFSPFYRCGNGDLGRLKLLVCFYIELVKGSLETHVLNCLVVSASGNL